MNNILYKLITEKEQHNELLKSIENDEQKEVFLNAFENECDKLQNEILIPLMKMANIEINDNEIMKLLSS